MSTYNGRRGPNVSQYLRDLNTISPQETTSDGENFNMEEELAFFTNTRFFDLDSGQNTDYQAAPVKPDAVATPAASSTEDPASVMGDISNMDFMNGELGRFCLSFAFCHYFLELPRDASGPRDSSPRIRRSWSPGDPMAPHPDSRAQHLTTHALFHPLILP